MLSTFSRPHYLIDQYPSIEETVGREIFRFAQHPPHTRFDTMGGFFGQYKELLGTLSPCDMVHLSSTLRMLPIQTRNVL